MGRNLAVVRTHEEPVLAAGPVVSDDGSSRWTWGQYDNRRRKSSMGKTPLPNHKGRRLLRELRKAREAAGLTQGEVGEKVHLDLQKVSRCEIAQVPTYHEMHALLEVYGIPRSKRGQYDELWELSRVKEWWHGMRLYDTSYVAAEHEASALFEFHLGHVPNLLQTEEYAQALAKVAIQGPELLDNDTVMEILGHRQSRLSDSTNPLAVHSIVDESVLQRGVDQAQLTHMFTCAEQLANLTLQVMPLGQQLQAGQFGTMIVLGFTDPDEEDQAFTPDVFGQCQRVSESRTRQIGRTLARLSQAAMSPDDSLRLLRKMYKSKPS
jgi:hypothetical protein